MDITAERNEIGQFSLAETVDYRVELRCAKAQANYKSTNFQTMNCGIQVAISHCEA